MDDDDVDDFLYGTSTTEVALESKDTNVSASNSPSQATAAIEKDVTNEDDEDLYQLYSNSSANEVQELSKQEVDTERDDASDSERPLKRSRTDADSDEEEESDDDLEIILEAEEDTSMQQASAQSDSQNGGDKSTSALVNLKPGQQANTSSSSATTAQAGGATASGSGTANKGNTASGGINLEAVGEYNGQPITEVDLDSFEDKPWRKPGADITDYFNYGFNEVTWRTYCAQQKMMRESKKMMGDMDMNDFMSMSMMMPPGAMMDPGMPMGMPGMPGMANPMMGMPMGMPPQGVGMGAAGQGPGPSGMRGNPGRGGGNFNMRGANRGGGPMTMGRGPKGNDGNGDRDSNDRNNGFYWPQMQPPFFP